MHKRFVVSVVVIAVTGALWVAFARAQTRVEAQAKPVEWPETPAGRWAKAYVEAYNTPGEGAVYEFVTDHFSKVDLRETSVKEVVAKYFQPRQMGLKRLEVRSVRTDGDFVAAVVAPAKPYGWIEFRFELSPEPPHSILGLKIGPTRPPGAKMQTAPEYTKSANLSGLVEQVRRDSGAPGIAVAIVRGGKVVDKAVAGVRRIDRPDRVQNGDLFHLGSIAKAFTATMIGKLVEEGKLHWDSTLGEVLSDLPMDPAYREVTLEQLLQHRGGVAPMPPATELPKAELGGQVTAAESRAATVRSVLAESPVKLGEYAYSNAGYVVAAYMAERAANEPWEKLMRRTVFEPLGLHTAGFGWPGVLAGSGEVDQPAGHLGTPPKLEVQEGGSDLLRDLRAIGPAGDLHCSIEDFARFAAFHLRGLRGEDGILKAETVQHLHTPAEGGHYMGGWVIHGSDGCDGHEGTAGTFFAEMIVCPDSDLAVVAVANCGPAVSPYFRSMNRAILRAVTSEVGRAGNAVPVQWPDTTAGRRAKAFVEAMNTGDDESLRRFVTENYSPESLREVPVQDRISMFQGIRAPMGTLQVSSVRTEGENTVIILAKCEKIGIWLELTIQLEKKAPHYWAGVKALPAAPP